MSAPPKRLPGCLKKRNFAKMRRIIGILLFALMSGTISVVARNVPDKDALSVAVAHPVMTTGQGCLNFTLNTDSPMTVEIYSITGQLIKKFSLGEGTVTIELPRGCYIVRCASWSKKVVVS